MADTSQCVLWALEQRCTLRASEESQRNPGCAHHTVSHAELYSEQLLNPNRYIGVFGDIFISGYSYARSDARGAPLNEGVRPASGFKMSEVFGPHGGIQGVSDMCRQCPANLYPDQLAVCVGQLDHRRLSRKGLEKQMRDMVSQLRLEREVEECFPPSTVLWYALWAVSPVPEKAMPVLRQLLVGMLEEDRRFVETSQDKNLHPTPGHFTNLEKTIAAIELAERNRLRFHVEIGTPGHTDFGTYTTFPHCPFCKAEASGERWQMNYPTDIRPCEVCGTLYSPAATASEEPMVDGPDLRTVVGELEYRGVFKDYLQSLGESAESAETIIQAAEKKDKEDAEYECRAEELEAQHEALLESHVFNGLPNVPPPYGQSSSSVSFTRYFDAETFAVVLRRCEQLGVEVACIKRVIEDQSCDGMAYPKDRSPLELLAEWRAQSDAGCFSAHLPAPEPDDLRAPCHPAENSSPPLRAAC